MGSIFVQQSPDHFLILGVILLCFILEKVNAHFAEGDRDLNCLIFQDEFLRRRKKVTHNLHLAHRLISVFYFPFHISLSPSANDPDFAFSIGKSHCQDSIGDFADAIMSAFINAVIQIFQDNTLVIEERELRQSK